jgi:hypothetical protein
VSLNCELGGLKVLTFVTRYEFCNLLGLKVCPAALGGSWFYAPFEGVTVKPPALPVVLDLGGGFVSPMAELVKLEEREV